MKKIGFYRYADFLIGFIIMNLIGYCLLSFCNWNYNPKEWSYFSRFCLGFADLIMIIDFIQEDIDF